MGNCMCIPKKTKLVQTDVPVLYTSDVPNGSNVQHPVGKTVNSTAQRDLNYPASYHQPPQVMGDMIPGSMAIVPMSDVMRTIPQNPVLPMSPTPMQPMVRVRALYTYDGQHPDDLAFQKGDTMYVLSDLSVEWWFAKHSRTGESGYVPSNYVLIDDGLPTSSEAWFDIGRREADRKLLLVGNPKGTYLIRPSSEPHNFALSVRHYDHEKNMFVVKHYRIRILDDNAGYYISNRINFQNIQDLIEYYSRNPEGLCCRLTIPCPRKYHPPVQFRAFEVNRESITRVRSLGHGSFGEVWLAKWNGSVEVAVKMRLENTDRARFIEEARLMHEFHHPRIVQLLGVCTLPEDQPVYIITELMRNGALVDFLRREEGRKLDLEDLIDMMAQVASGMSYLEEKNSVHRDLRAANILVDSDNSVKVSDFGLAKIISDDTQTDHQTKFPIKWTAPEAALQHKFSIKSDVWSFGVLMYEIVTYGGTPYPGMAPRQTVTEVEKGYRLPNPSSSGHRCPDDLYNLMLRCWDAVPENRPTFRSLNDVLEHWCSHTETQYLDN